MWLVLLLNLIAAMWEAIKGLNWFSTKVFRLLSHVMYMLDILDIPSPSKILIFSAQSKRYFGPIFLQT